MEPKFGSVVEWYGGQQCMVITVDPPMFIQLSTDPFDPTDGEPPYMPGESNYPFHDHEAWTVLDA